MTTPRLEIHLDRLGHNARTLLGRLATKGISVTAVTKATLGSPEVADELLGAGVAAIGESRIENIESLRRGGISAPITLIRSPMISQVDRIVAHADVSLNTELDVLAALSDAARRHGRTHGVVLMVELGDLREGILPDDVELVARRTLDLPSLALRGIGTNLACQSGVAPDARNMSELSSLAIRLEATLGTRFDIVSGGNSASLGWALGRDDIGRINDLRIGEAILLGRDPLDRRPIDGLRTDAVQLVAEVIESTRKPTTPWGDIHQDAFGGIGAGINPGEPCDTGTPGDAVQVIAAVGRQDVEPDGLRPPDGVEILGASSDHLVLRADDHIAVGSELSFGVDGYGALLRAMTSPFVARVFLPDSSDRPHC
jgi:ornithine racemase